MGWGMWTGQVLLMFFATAVPESGQHALASGRDGGAAAAGADEAACAVEAPSTQLSVTELPHGAELTYATQVNLVGAVQRLVRDFADRQNGGSPVAQGFGDPQLHGGTVGAPPGTDVLIPGSHATVTNTSSGARLTLEPVAAPLRRLLRAAAGQQARLLRQRPCPPDLRLTPAPPSAPDAPTPR